MRVPIDQVDRMPNTSVQLRREAPSAQKHQGVMGPGAAFFYFGPEGAPGHIIYGNAPSQPMATTLRRKRSTACVFLSDHMFNPGLIDWLSS